MNANTTFWSIIRLIQLIRDNTVPGPPHGHRLPHGSPDGDLRLLGHPQVGRQGAHRNYLDSFYLNSIQGNLDLPKLSSSVSGLMPRVYTIGGSFD